MCDNASDRERVERPMVCDDAVDLGLRLSTWQRPTVFDDAGDYGPSVCDNVGELTSDFGVVVASPPLVSGECSTAPFFC